MVDRAVLAKKIARNLIAHQYGVIDFHRVFVVARDDARDLTAFCQQLSQRAGTD